MSGAIVVIAAELVVAAVAIVALVLAAETVVETLFRDWG